MSTVIGIDPSLSSTGIAIRKNDKVVRTWCITAAGLRGVDRLAELRKSVQVALMLYRPQLVAYEGYAFGFRGKSNALFSLGELGGVLKLLILESGIDILLVPPTVLKMFVTGNGAAKKEEVGLALQEELGVSFATSDQADAAGLLLMGEAYLNRRLLPRHQTHHKVRAIKGCTKLSAI